MKRVLVTGASGYLGRHVARALEKEWDVLKLDRTPEREGLSCDLLDGDTLTKLFKTHSPEIVVHLAAVNEIVCIENPGLALQVNGLGSKNVAEAAVAAGVQRLIYVSTFHVYGSCDGTITEETVPIPSHPYGISKLVGELFCRKEGLATIILRCANGVGVPHDPDEIERIDPFTDKIPYTWDLRHE